MSQPRSQLLGVASSKSVFCAAASDSTSICLIKSELELLLFRFDLPNRHRSSHRIDNVYGRTLVLQCTITLRSKRTRVSSLGGLFCCFVLSCTVSVQSIEMCSEATVKNTLAFVFPENAAQPNLAEMAGFIKTLIGDVSTMDTTYKISDEKSVFIRFRSEEAMKFCLENNSETLPFHYTNGKKVMVHMCIAGGNTRYVRIFDLPPEVSDEDLTSVLAKYGVVKRTVRERFPMEFQLDLFTGVRGVYMNIDRDIPEILHFQNRKGRIFYAGRKAKCFTCRSDTHLKKSCPTLQKRRYEAQKQQLSTTEQKPEEEEVVSAVGDDKSNWIIKVNKKRKPKRKKNTSNHQSSIISKNQTTERKNAIGSSTNESDSSKTTGFDSLSAKRRFRVPRYEWFEDVNERQQLIEEDKIRIAAALNINVDQIEVYHD